MSRSEKRRKRERREQLQSQATTLRVHARRTRSDVEEAAWLVERRQWREAREKLEECDRLAPDQPDVLRLLVKVYSNQHDFSNCARACERLVAQVPGDPTAHLMLAGSYMATSRHFAALRLVKDFLARWPHDEQAGPAREMLGSLEPGLNRLLAAAPFPEAQKLELAELHEDVMAAMADGDFERMIRVGQQLLGRAPDFAPVQNNLALAYRESGRIGEAISMSQSVVEREPDNFHALSNLVRYLTLCGKHAEAEAFADRLRRVQSDNPDCCVKRAEAFSYLGNDQDVLKAFADSQRFDPQCISPGDSAVLHHLAAVAHARQGDSAAAVRLWKKSLKLRPHFDLAEENLNDARQPPDMRHGPWPYSLGYWMCRQTVEELKPERNDRGSTQGEPSDADVLSHFAARHPELVDLLPLLFDRGDGAARKFACLFARALDTPPAVEAVRTFCLSQRGPDEMRMEVAGGLAHKGALPEGPVRLWLKGEWQDVELRGYELTGEPNEFDYANPQTVDWLNDSIEATHRSDFASSERLLRKCLAAEGDRPELLHNLAVAMKQQGRTEEGMDLVRQVHARWPDYFFGRTTLATIAASEGDFKRAEELLAPLQEKRRMHSSEFSALCITTIQLLGAQCKFDKAREWLSIWKSAQPDHPMIAQLERTLDRKQMLDRARSWLPFGKDRRA